MRMRLIVIRFALTTLSLMASLAAICSSADRGQTNSQWNTMGEDKPGWLTTSKDDGGDGPPVGATVPRKG